MTTYAIVSPLICVRLVGAVGVSTIIDPEGLSFRRIWFFQCCWTTSGSRTGSIFGGACQREVSVFRSSRSASRTRPWLTALSATSCKIWLRKVVPSTKPLRLLGGVACSPVLDPKSYCHLYACVILCDHEADSPLPQRGADQEAADAVREDWRSGSGTRPACD